MSSISGLIRAVSSEITRRNGSGQERNGRGGSRKVGEERNQVYDIHRVTHLAISCVIWALDFRTDRPKIAEAQTKVTH